MDDDHDYENSDNDHDYENSDHDNQNNGDENNDFDDNKISWFFSWKYDDPDNENCLLWNTYRQPMIPQHIFELQQNFQVKYLFSSKCFSMIQFYL